MLVRVGTLVVILSLALLQQAAAEGLDPDILGLAHERAIELNLAPDVSAMLWFRYSTGSRAPERPEHVVSFLHEEIDSNSTSEGRYALRIVIREATEPILNQVFSALETSAGLPIEAAARRVQVRIASASEKKCPAIRKAHLAFSQAIGSALKLDTERLGFYHGPAYQIEGYSKSAFFSLTVKSGNPLFRWAEETHAALEACSRHNSHP